MNRYDELQDNGPNIWQAKLEQQLQAEPHPPTKADRMTTQLAVNGRNLDENALLVEVTE